MRKSKRPPIFQYRDDEQIVRETDDKLYRAWADRQDIAVSKSSREIFDRLLQTQKDDGWLN